MIRESDFFYFIKSLNISFYRYAVIGRMPESYFSDFSSNYKNMHLLIESDFLTGTFNYGVHWYLNFGYHKREFYFYDIIEQLFRGLYRCITLMSISRRCGLCGNQKMLRLFLHKEHHIRGKWQFSYTFSSKNTIFST